MMSGMTSSATFPRPIHLFEMKGRDARDFLNRLSTVNLRELSEGAFGPGFLLNPQGKIRAAFRVAVASADSFLLEVEGGANSQWKDSFLAYLDQFTFTEKYEITERTGLTCAWIFNLSKAPENSYLVRDGLTFLYGSKQAFGMNWTSVWGEAPLLDDFLKSQSTAVLTESEFENIRILSLYPRIDVELLLDSNPLELGLRDAISDNKGCYPGQEVIEKIISLGSPAKRLAMLRGPGSAPIPGAKIFLSGAEVGIVSSATRDDSGFAALALLRKNAAHDGQALTIGDGSNPSPATVERISKYA